MRVGNTVAVLIMQFFLSYSSLFPQDLSQHICSSNKCLLHRSSHMEMCISEPPFFGVAPSLFRLLDTWVHLSTAQPGSYSKHAEVREVQLILRNTDFSFWYHTLSQPGHGFLFCPKKPDKVS